MAKDKFQLNFMMNQTETVKRFIHSYIHYISNNDHPCHVQKLEVFDTLLLREAC